MIVELIIVICVVLVIGFIANTIMDIRKKSKCDKMSFKEALDLAELPVITFRNNNVKLNFLLDTGATLSIIDNNLLESNKDIKYIERDIKGTIYGMEGNTQEVGYINMDISYNSNTYNEDFQILDMSEPFNKLKEETGVTVVGILSSSFFAKYKYVLDYNEMVAYSKK